MGVQTIITCDKCDKVLHQENITCIDIEIETDHNWPHDGRDERKRWHKIYCVECATPIKKLLEELP